MWPRLPTECGYPCEDQHPGHLRAEVVSPVLGYDDIPQLQEVVRAIRRAGGKINSQCGIHIHIDAAFKNGRPKPEDVLPDETETTTLTNEAGQVPGLTV